MNNVPGHTPNMIIEKNNTLRKMYHGAEFFLEEYYGLNLLKVIFGFEFYLCYVNLSKVGYSPFFYKIKHLEV